MTLDSTWRLVIPPFPGTAVDDLLESYGRRSNRRNITRAAKIVDGNLVLKFSAPDETTAQKRARYIFCDVARWPNNNSADGHYTVTEVNPAGEQVGYVPKIEILHTRDPDSECGITVWLDGKRIDTFAEESLDPGRGWTREDWDEATRDTREEHPEYSDAFRQAAVEAWESFANNKFVTDA